MNLSTLLLGRSSIGGDAQGTGLAQIGGLFAAGDAFFGLGIQRLCFGCPTANHRERLDHDRALVKANSLRAMVIT